MLSLPSKASSREWSWGPETQQGSRVTHTKIWHLQTGRTRPETILLFVKAWLALKRFLDYLPPGGLERLWLQGHGHEISQ